MPVAKKIKNKKDTPHEVSFFILSTLPNLKETAY
jgi:hypothetical protein